MDYLRKEMGMSKIGHNADGCRDYLILEARRLDQEIRERAGQLHDIERELRSMRTIVYDLPRVYDVDEVDLIRRMNQAISEAGGQTQFARLCQVSRQYLHDCLKGRRRPSGTVLKQLGLRRIEVYVAATDKGDTARSVGNE